MAVHDALPLTQVLHLQAGLLGHRKLAPAMIQLASDVADMAGCERATVALCESAHLRLVAVSHAAQARFQGRSSDDVIAAMEEARAQRASVFLPPPVDGVPRIAVSHERLLTGGCQAAASFPLWAGETMVGLLTLQWHDATLARAFDIPRFEHQLSLLGPLVALFVRAEQPLVTRWRQHWQESSSTPRRRRQAAWAAAAAGVIALLAWPTPQSVSGRARIEGAVERTVSAPTDGFLQSVRARPGDRVEEGALLLELADQELRAELQRLAGEVAEHESAYLSALSRSDRAEMAVRQSRMEEAKGRHALAEGRLQRASVTAPMTGVVIEGDLTRSVGAPVRRGDKLLIVAPREQFRVVVEVSERDIANVYAGQKARLLLSASPWDELPAAVTRVVPVARSANGDNVFEVEAMLTAPAEGLRPGMTGVARLHAERQALGAVVAQRMLDTLRLRWWQWTF